tara:strand:- start:134 stop:910 length:777 start_codon:yes stop_codon:yes gene_type:complete
LKREHKILNTEIQYNGKLYSLNMDNGVDLSIKNDFSGKGPIFYSSDWPKVEYARSSDFLGDIRKGGSCNVPIVSLNIHCTGTHTESSAHISENEKDIPEVCPKGLIPAYLVSISPKNANDTKELYHCKLSHELVITAESLKEKLFDSFVALIVRTTPNDSSKIYRNYDRQPAPFFTNNAIDYIIELGIEHLLVDTPSIDKADDGGLLGNHRRFFKQGKTISELLYIPNSIPDGLGFLQIQIPNWRLDAVPSRPIFYAT